MNQPLLLCRADLVFAGESATFLRADPRLKPGLWHLRLGVDVSVHLGVLRHEIPQPKNTLSHRTQYPDYLYVVGCRA